ncbi:hypothetical protein F5Y01DRAFT_198788 [Xylaria sp. FL0043]|nr:hypothetical protein F5Y01DRAFT_198788 [Xylaria sp. FL0043]
MYWGSQHPPPPAYPTGPHWNPTLIPAAPAPGLIPTPTPQSNGLHAPGEAPLSVVSVKPVAPTKDDNASNAIEPIEGEPKEKPCNYTWALDRAEIHLGFTGKYKTESEVRKTSIGYDIALILQKLLKKVCATLDRHVTLANRVHILTVMREILMATLEAEGTVGKECRECSREFDSTYLAAVHKFTPAQLRRLKDLEDGKWLEEMQDLINEANRQKMFPLLRRAFDYINSAA